MKSVLSNHAKYPHVQMSLSNLKIKLKIYHTLADYIYTFKMYNRNLNCDFSDSSVIVQINV